MSVHVYICMCVCVHRLKHRMLEEKHKGHEVMHLEMILIFFGSIIVTQLILVLWRTKHKKSYQVSSLVPPSASTGIRNGSLYIH